MLSEKCGKIISEVSFEQKGTIKIVFQDRTEVKINERTFGDFYLYAGKTLTESEWSDLERAIRSEKYKDYLLRLLNRSLYSEKEISDRLKAKKCPDEISEDLIADLKKKKLIDDERYAYLLKEECENKNWGKHKIIREAKEKGISESIVGRWVFAEETESEKAKRVSEKYCRGNRKPFRQLQSSLYAHLIAWGFDKEICDRAVADVKNCVSPESDIELLRVQMEKMKVTHNVDLSDRKEREKWIKKWIYRGFSYRDIEKCMEEYYGKTD